MTTVKYIIYSDLDGTLLDHFTYETTAAIETLAQLEVANIPVVLNTSKTFAEVECIHNDLSLTAPFIVENGAAIYIPIDTFAHQPEGTEAIGNYWVKSFAKPISHWLTLLNEQASEYAEEFQGFSSMTEQKVVDITGLSLAEAKRAKTREFGEPILWLGAEAKKKAFVEHMLDLGAHVVQGGRFLHVSDFSDKGQALLWLTEQYHEDYQTHFDSPAVCTISLGDGENDSAMLEASDIAVQVRSPIHDYPNLSRQKVTLQTSLFGPEGWAEAINELLATQLTCES